MKFNLEFYRGKKVLVTGHTGFKGAWMSHLLVLAGADVTGIALEPLTDPSLFDNPWQEAIISVPMILIAGLLAS